MISQILIATHVLLFGSFLLRILYRDDLSSSARLAWFLVLMTVPYFGVIVYLLFGEINLGRTIHDRHDEILDSIRQQAQPLLGNCSQSLSKVMPVNRAAFLAAASADGFATTLGNRGELMKNGQIARLRLVDDIDNATDFVHVLYYIWLNDQTGTEVAEALIRAVQRGVKCRAMADGLGSRAMIRSSLWKKMTHAGVETEVALPIKGIVRTILFSRLDLRNHRKITVIDGQITYCGSQNCADPEFRVKPKYAPWVDIMIRFEGPVVAQNQVLFASDWILNRPTAQMDDFDFSFEQYDDGFPAQVFGDGPTERQGITHQFFSTIIAQAQEKLIITTPYFVPDSVVLNAILAAAYRGVDVKMVFPQNNDSWIVAAASRSYYGRLLKAGVQIFEFTGGLLHAKTLTMDHTISFVGSTNLDLRSFDLNYENDVLFQDEELTGQVQKRQFDYIEGSVLVTLDEVQGWSSLRQIKNNVIATLGPIL